MLLPLLLLLLIIIIILIIIIHHNSSNNQTNTNTITNGAAAGSQQRDPGALGFDSGRDVARGRIPRNEGRSAGNTASNKDVLA